MAGFALTLAYKGAAYSGWQVQKNALGVQTVVQDAVEKLFGTRLNVTGCSRTDSGVHARGYVCHIEPPCDFDVNKLPQALNMYLPKDVAVLSARAAKDGFHARYSALGKEYVYILSDSPVRNPFWDGLLYRYNFPVDAERADALGQSFVGKQDFRSFMSAGSKISDTVRTVHYFRVKREEDRLIITTAADGFLYNMVRIMVGTLLKAAKGQLDIPAVIAAADRNAAGPTAPAEGLYLNRVFYDNAALDAAKEAYKF